jgi:hypothetical protein
VSSLSTRGRLVGIAERETTNRHDVPLSTVNRLRCDL